MESTTDVMAKPAAAGARIPRGAVFIVAMEACERFSYYGVLSILTLYLSNGLSLGEAHAKEVVHLFKSAVYFLPLLGGFLADRFLGRYRTILFLSVFYCLGHGVIALTDARLGGLYTGLALIALGAGGIKPCVSAFLGDQFPASARDRWPQVYGFFYWSINLGATLAFACVPLIRDHLGVRWAFGVPGLFMGIAAFVFWLGSRDYVRHPAMPARTGDSTAWDLAAVGRIALVLLPVPVFWALYDQLNSSWVLQGAKLQEFYLGTYKVDAERMQSVSGLLVLFWVPVLAWIVYPSAARAGWNLTPLRRMGAGMVFTAISYLGCAALQWQIESGAKVSLGWQVANYTVLELGEVLVSATGLEFAYSQAPERYRGLVMSLWLCTVSVGNLLVAGVTWLNTDLVHATGTAEFLFYSALMFVVTAVFAQLAKGYRNSAPL